MLITGVNGGNKLLTLNDEASAIRGEANAVRGGVESSGGSKVTTILEIIFIDSLFRQLHNAIS